MKSLQQTVARWNTGASGAQQAYTDGINNTSVDVMGNAVRASAAAVRNYTLSHTSGQYAAAVASSGGTANWKAQAIKKAGNFGTGVSQGQDKYQAAMGRVLPFIESTVASLPARQPGNVQANVQRVLILATALHNAKGQFKG